MAEVLITLGIIGVVAAMTMPVLLQKLDNRSNISSLKKSYSIFSQATNLVISEYQTPKNWDLKNDDSASISLLYSYYKPYLNIVRNCENNIECWSFPTMSLDNENIIIDESSYWIRYSSFFVLADGTTVYLDVDDNVVNVFFDVNGFKKPNKLGRDVFMFQIREDGFLPYGMGNTQDCSINSLGRACAAKIMEDGWQMKY